MNRGDLLGHMHASWDNLSTTSWCHWEGAYLLLLLLVITVIKEDFFFFFLISVFNRRLCKYRFHTQRFSGENKTGLGSLL